MWEEEVGLHVSFHLENFHYGLAVLCGSNEISFSCAAIHQRQQSFKHLIQHKIV